MKTMGCKYTSALFFIFLFRLPSAFCQITENKDSVVQQVQEKEKNWEFDFQIDQRNSIFLNNSILGSDVSSSINGVSVGYTYKDRFRIGVGGYFSNAQRSKAFVISNTFYDDKIKQLAPDATPINLPGRKGYLVNSSLTMYYVTPSFEYIFFHSKWLDFSIPLEIGVGYSNLTLNDYFTNTSIPLINKKGKVLKGSDILLPALIGLNGNVNLSPDVLLSTSIGYRTTLKEIGISQNFDGLYYQVGLQLLPGRIKAEAKKDYIEWKVKRKKKKAERRSARQTPAN